MGDWRQPASDIVVPVVRTDERWGPKPGKWRDRPTTIPPSTYERPYEDRRTQLPLELPETLPEWERPEPQQDRGYERTYDDGRMTVIRGPDEMYRRKGE